MERILVCYSDDKYRPSRKLCAVTGNFFGGFTRVDEYTPNDIDYEFAVKNSGILSVKRGAGLWLWKPYVIRKSLLKANPGDIVFYCDAGAFFIRSVGPVISSMNQDVWIMELLFDRIQGKNQDSYYTNKIKQMISSTYRSLIIIDIDNNQKSCLYSERRVAC